jgi:ATP-binding cassette subfamily F protein 3
LRNELAKIDARMAQAHSEQAQAQDRLCAADVPATERTELGKQLKNLGDELEALELRWLELTEQIEQISSQAGD